MVKDKDSNSVKRVSFELDSSERLIVTMILALLLIVVGTATTPRDWATDVWQVWSEGTEAPARDFVFAVGVLGRVLN